MNNNLKNFDLHGHTVDLDTYDFDGARGVVQFFGNLEFYLDIYYDIDEDKFIKNNGNKKRVRYAVKDGYITVLANPNSPKIVKILGSYYLKSQLNDDGIPVNSTKYIHRCPVCHTLYTTDGSMCKGCFDVTYKQLGYYHDHKGHLAKCFDDNNNAVPFDSKTFKGYGFELETENHKINTSAYYHEIMADLLQGHCYGETDGSLCNGIEIISYPHTKKALFDYDFKNIFNKLIADGFTSYSNGRCGLHIHASRLLFGDTDEEQDMNISKILYFIYYNWTEFEKFSRRKIFFYCRKPLTNISNPDRKQILDRVKEKNIGRGALNINNDSTVEFRLPRGSLNYNTWRATIDFYDCLIKNSKKISWSDINDRDKWLEGIEDNTKNYINKRHMWQNKSAGRVIGDK